MSLPYKLLKYKILAQSDNSMIGSPICIRTFNQASIEGGLGLAVLIAKPLLSDSWGSRGTIQKRYCLWIGMQSAAIKAPQKHLG